MVEGGGGRRSTIRNGLGTDETYFLNNISSDTEHCIDEASIANNLRI